MAISFSPVGSFAGVGGTSVLTNPTVVQFGPDGRLYVAEQNGTINAFTVETQDGQYIATAHETLTLVSGLEVVKSIQNHNDNGAENTLLDRQATGMVVTGTAENPVIYVASSDPRIAHNVDLNIDTNSGVITRLTWNGSSWDAVDIVRGLPRSEENHSTNGLTLSADGTKLYAMQGGNTNNGAPSSYFSYLPEYALSGALLEIDLVDIESRPILVDPQGGQNDTPRQYVYDLPTLDDPSVVNGGTREDAGGMDILGPWGGNDGLNQAILPADAPLRIYADGFRNAYDVVLTESGRLYTFDNGSNQGLGGDPIVQNGEATNTPNGGGVGDPEPLFLIEEGGYYGHPNPTRSNQDGFLTSYDDAGNPNPALSVNTIPNLADAVPGAVNIQDGFIVDPSKFTGDAARLLESGIRVLHQSPESKAITLLGSSANGITEYTGDAFGGALNGALLVTQFNGSVTLLNLNAAGTALAPLIGPGPDGILGTPDDVVEDSDGLVSLISGQSQPLDVTIGPNGTIWVAVFGSDVINVFAPSDLVLPDDPDYDNDGILNELDPFIRDASNGGSVFVRPGQTYLWDFDANQDNNLAGPNGYGGGLTGVMIDGETDFEKFFQEASPFAGQIIKLDNVKFTTAAGGGTTVIENVSNGAPQETRNSGEYLFHTGMGIAPTVETFTVTWSVVNPAALFTGASQQIGGYLGTGDQSNYLKIVAIQGAVGEIQIVLENDDIVVSTTYIQADDLFSVPADQKIFFEFEVDTAAGTATPTVTYETGGGNTTTVSGSAINLDGTLVLDAIRGDYTVGGQSTGLAVGLLASNTGQPVEDTFQAIFDGIEINATGDASQTIIYRVNAGGHATAAIDGGPNWSADTGANKSPYLSTVGSSASVTAVAPGGTVPATAPAEIFLTQRWDPVTAPEMAWSFATPGAGLYEVRLYLGDSYDGTAAPGQRVFDVSIEGKVLPNLNDVDLSAQFGHDVGGVISNFVEVTDGAIDIEFLHVMQNPLVNGIEIILHGTAEPGPLSVSITGNPLKVGEGAGQIVIPLTANKPVPAGETVTMTYVITPNTATPQVDYTVPGAQYNSGSGTFTGTVQIAAGESQATIPVDILQDSQWEGNEAFAIEITDISPNSLLGTSSASVTILEDDINPDDLRTGILYRVNTGGKAIAAIDGGPNWTADTGLSNSPHLTSPGSNNNSASDAVPGSTVPTTTPAGIFLAERWDKPGDAEMAWTFAVPIAGLYEVRLYMGNGYDGTSLPGQRVFDVAIEGTVLPNLDNVDLSLLFGHEVGGMISNTVEITDGAINIEFIHGANNPLINGIEIIAVDEVPVSVSIAGEPFAATEGAGQILIPLVTSEPVPAGETVTVTYAVTPNTATPQADYTVPGAQYNTGSQTFTGTVQIAAGASQAAITVNILQDTQYEGNEFFDVEIIDVSSNAIIGTSSATVSILDDDEVPGTVLYRVNAGGQQIAATDGGPNWTVDTGASNSLYLSNPGSNNASASDVTPGVTVPLTTPAEIFLTERWDKPGGAEMAWAFAVPDDGLYEVRLFMGNGHDASSAPGKRVFDVSIEGTVLPNLDDVDLSVLFGHDTGGMISNTIEVTDGTINIEFIHGVQNPLVNGIEIIKVATSDPLTVSITSDPLSAGEGAGQILIPLLTNRAVPSGETVTVSYAITAGTATPQADFTVNGAQYDASIQTYTGTVQIAAGASQAAIAVNILQDTAYEGNEAFNVAITNVSANASIGTSSGSVTIVDDDPVPQINFGATVTAGGSTTIGTSAFKITNTSQAGVVIKEVSFDIGTATLSYGLNLSGAPGTEFLGSVWDPTGEAGDTGSQGLWFSTNVAGLLDAQGNVLAPVTSGPGYTGTAGVYPFVEQLPGGNAGAPGGYRHMSLDFGDFNVGEQFAFGVDVDPQSIQGASGSGGAGGVSGGEVAGTTVTITFEDTASGQTYTETRQLAATGLNSSKALFTGTETLSAPALNVVGLTSGTQRQVWTTKTQQVVEVTGLAQGDKVRLYVFDASGYEKHGGSGSEIIPEDPFHANQFDAAPTILNATADASGTATFNVTLANVAGASPAKTDGMFFFSAGVVNDLGELVSQLAEPAELKLITVGLSSTPLAASEEAGQIQIPVSTNEVVPAGETLAVSYAITAGTATPQADFTVPGAQYNAATQTYTGTVQIAGGTSQAEIPVNILQDSSYEGHEAFNVAITGVDPSVLVGTSAKSVTILEDDVNPGVLLYRVNAGGPQIVAIDGGPNWLADTPSNNSPYLSSPGSNNASASDAVPGVTVPATTPAGIFLTERWDKPGDAEMAWSFAVPEPGLYEVRLFMGNGYDGAAAPGKRVFDVSIEGTVPSSLDNVDLSARFGHEVGGMISNFVQVTDGAIDLQFIHGVNNPIVNGIEIWSMEENATFA